MARKDFQPRDKNFSQFPLLWLAVCFAAGISAAHSVNISFYLWLLLLFVATTGAVWFFLEKKHLQSTVSLFFAFTVAGAFSVAAEKQTVGLNRISQIYDTGEITFQTPVVLMGALASEPEQTPNGYFLTLQAEQIEFNENMRAASGRVRLFLPLDTPQAKREYETLALRYGAKVKAVTRLTREDRFRNPGGTNYKKILETKNLEATGALRNVASVQKISDFEGFDLSGWIYRWRAALVKQFAQNFSIQTAGVLSASLLNNRYFLDKSTASRFREGGTFHVLVISGVHITFIGFLIIWSVRKITRRHAAQFIAANVLLWTYTIAVGAETPVVRAALMFTIFHAATLVYRQNVSLNALGATALLLLIARPSDLFDQSFQLTFLSVGAIVAVAFPILEKMREIGSWQLSEQTPVPPTCAKWLKTLCETLFWNEQSWQHAQARTVWKARLFKSKFAGKLVRLSLQAAWQTVFSAVFVSVVVAICLLPLMAIYFHRLSIASVFLNVFVGFLIAVESLVGVWALLVAQISGTLAAPFIAWTEWCNFLLIASAEPFIERNLASVRLPIYTGARSAIYWLYYLPLVFLAIAAHGWNPFELRKTENGEWKTENKKIMLLFGAQCLLFALIVFHPFSAATTGGRLQIDFLDVGQGDAALITTPSGTKILVDAGGKANFLREDKNSNAEVFVPDARSIGESVVCEFLWEKGFDRVDFLLPTHADLDHIDGLNDVAQNFGVQKALVGRTPTNNSNFMRFAQTLEKHAIPLEKIARGNVLEIDNVRIEILAPEPNYSPDAPAGNNQSIVFRLVYGERGFLFTGDIEAETEKFLSQQPEILSSDVVKVAHHGSKTSSTLEFVRATKAQFAVISVGRESPYGHPHQEAVKNWQNSGAQILATGQKGTISFSTDGADLELETFCQ